jgi:hypothetical protein
MPSPASTTRHHAARDDCPICFADSGHQPDGDILDFVAAPADTAVRSLEATAVELGFITEKR